MKTLSCSQWVWVSGALTFAVASLAVPAQAAHLRRVAVVQTETFRVASNAVIAVGANRHASLGDVKVGDRISVAYLDQGGTLMARHISDGVPHKPRTSESTPQKPQHHSSNSNLLHVHGVVNAVDPEAGTVTITHRRR